MEKMDIEYNEYIAGLAYLFVDGEASETEKEALFMALPNNTWLQKELQSAILISNTARAEFSEVVLPPSMETGLMAKAGFIGDPSISRVSRTVKTKFANSLLNKWIIPMFSGIIGAILTYLLFYAEKNDSGNADAKMIAANLNGGIAQNYFIHGIGSEDNQLKAGKENIKYVYLSGSPGSTTSLPEPDTAFGRSVITDTKMADSIEKAEISVLNYSFPDNSMQSVDYNNTIDIPNALELDINDYNLWERLSFQVSGISGIALFPARDVVQSNMPDINNISVEARYRLGESFYLGAAAGTETFPIYIENSKNELVYNTSINWYGISACYSGFSIFDDSIKPYFDLFGGYTVSGPIFKAGAGLSWKPDSNTRLHFGCEGTSLAYIYHGIWKAGQKISFVYGLEINF